MLKIMETNIGQILRILFKQNPIDILVAVWLRKDLKERGLAIYASGG